MIIKYIGEDSVTREGDLFIHESRYPMVAGTVAYLVFYTHDDVRSEIHVTLQQLQYIAGQLRSVELLLAAGDGMVENVNYVEPMNE